MKHVLTFYLRLVRYERQCLQTHNLYTKTLHKHLQICRKWLQYNNYKQIQIKIYVKIEIFCKETKLTKLNFYYKYLMLKLRCVFKWVSKIASNCMVTKLNQRNQFFFKKKIFSIKVGVCFSSYEYEINLNQTK